MLTTTLFSFLFPAAFVFAAPVRFAPVKRAVEIDGAKAYEPDRYIVALKTNTVDPNNRKEWLSNVLASADLNIATVPETTLKTGWNADIFNGLSGTFTAAELKAIQSQPEVDWIAEDLEMRTLAIVQQTNAPWGIARFSTGEQSFAGNDPTLLQFPFTFDDAAVGAGTDVYIIDTGIRTTHQDFGSRASFLASFGTGVVGQDINGHGTHCAGSAAGNVFGIAKEANILAVKVMADDGSGATSDIISGIVASFDNFVQTGRPSVASMSLGGPINQAIDQAVAGAVAGGLPFVVAAGNETQDAENVSPARLPEAITVGATDINDNIAFFSNFGPAVDVFAPGDIIPSAGQLDDLQVVNLSGTSMACPQVAGLALTLLGQNPGLTPAQLKDAIVGSSVNNVIANLPGGTANQLASNGV